MLIFSSRRRHTICLSDWSSDVCSSDLVKFATLGEHGKEPRSAARFFAMLAQGGELDGVRLLSEERVRWFSVPRPPCEYRSEERRVGKECRSRWSPYH